MGELSKRPESIVADPWAQLRRHTAARIALGRAGASLPTSEVLRFAMDHALARDAVHSQLDPVQLEGDLRAVGLPILRVTTCVTDRMMYLQRPDLGRKLAPGMHDQLKRLTTPAGFDLSVAISDGLSAQAAQLHAAPLLKPLLPRLREVNLSIAPLVIAPFARVALQDEVGSALGSRCSVILLGERPGLGTPDSLSAYLVYAPRPGNTDANRNCVSNIRPAGLKLEEAARTLEHLIRQSLALKLSGVGLKDDRPREAAGSNALE